MSAAMTGDAIARRKTCEIRHELAQLRTTLDEQKSQMLSSLDVLHGAAYDALSLHKSYSNSADDIAKGVPLEIDSLLQETASADVNTLLDLIANVARNNAKAIRTAIEEANSPNSGSRTLAMQGQWPQKWINAAIAGPPGNQSQGGDGSNSIASHSKAALGVLKRTISTAQAGNAPLGDKPSPMSSQELKRRLSQRDATRKAAEEKDELFYSSSSE
ncbi:uncharacterized protein KY384_004104 [Bacidia gigantensis]|uniref:uncharacterized protein n=1 Tax=Bacidia gigantensis TaxID=2732470 RepID=UPI001D04947D|nr:uncharacterized protein KY384_004104 [Bacidia gigantensis]KAG8530747.1 hypothetical protein KY384_004104 [Bacidia gigantensis]